MSANSTFVSPSDEVISEVAKRVAEAYPGLYSHQHAGVAFLLSRKRAILADDMGLGKTRQALVAMREAEREGNILVVAPAGVKLTWARELEALEPGADVHVVHSRKDWEAGHRWTVVNYELLGRLKAEITGEAWAGVIVDEAHYIKNDSQRTTAVLNLIGSGGKGRKKTADGGPGTVYLLTGTPMANRPRDLFNLLRAVNHPLSTSFLSYARRYCAAYQNGFGWDTNGASNLEELAQVVSGVMLRRTKDEALDLPPKMRSWQPVELEKPGAVARDERAALAFLDRNPDRNGPAWGQFLGLLNKARHTLALAKVDATIDAVRERVEAGEKVVVFSSYTGVVERLMTAFPGEAVSITGADSAAQRAAAAQALQEDPTTRVLVGNLQAAGVGITLTAATHVIFNDLDWVPGNHWQAEDRIYRIGQTRPAFVTYLVAEGTLDDYVAALLEAKSRNIGVLEANAAEQASLLQEVVEAAATGVRPRSRERAVVAAPQSVGLLEETLDLLARAQRGLAAAGPAEQVFTIASKSEPGKSYRVVVAAGVPECECAGFSYRGNCSHARDVAKRLSEAEVA